MTMRDAVTVFASVGLPRIPSIETVTLHGHQQSRLPVSSFLSSQIRGSERPQYSAPVHDHPGAEKYPADDFVVDVKSEPRDHCPGQSPADHLGADAEELPPIEPFGLAARRHPLAPYAFVFSLNPGGTIL
jgi:hypothetical protein